jgi:hypothetical protein
VYGVIGYVALLKQSKTFTDVTLHRLIAAAAAAQRVNMNETAVAESLLSLLSEFVPIYFQE